jgi:integrase
MSDAISTCGGDMHLAEAGEERNADSWGQGYGRVRAVKPEYPSPLGASPHTWKTRLAHLLREFGHMKARGSGRASHRTVEVRKEALYSIFRLVREAGFKLEDPANIDARHVRCVYQEWQRRRKLHDEGQPGGLAPATVANAASVLRTFCAWIGQPQLIDVARVGDETLARRTKVAMRDPTWEGAGIDTLEMIERAWRLEPWVCVALLLQYTFGLREREAVMFRPDVACRPGEMALSINIARKGARGMCGKVSAGSKGGRPRIILIHAPWEMSVLEFSRRFVLIESGVDGHLGQVERDLMTNMRRYRLVLEKLGITRGEAGVSGHGLRAAFAIRALHRQGLEAPVRGGDLTVVDKRERDRILKCVAEDLGHSRASIGSAYYGSAAKKGTVKAFDGKPDEVLAPKVLALLARLEVELQARIHASGVLRRYRKTVGGNGK